MDRFGFLWLAAIICCGFCGSFFLASACTTIVVGKEASADGSTICTHNADCGACDFRLGRVPSRDWPLGSKRPVIKYRSEYPRTVTEERGRTWAAENLDPRLPQRSIWANESWKEHMVLGYIPQVNHTFAYLEGLYGIINEKQVAIGESTCGAKWFSGPVSDDCAECNSLFDASELSRVALERASTAREAITIMGKLGVEHGFYGSEWVEERFIHLEAGEALTVTDPNEAWVFHILPDSTTKSAVWAAQRVPDDHISVVANQFIIKEVYPDANGDFFMSSENLFQMAEQAGVGYEQQSGLPVHFTHTFGLKDPDLPTSDFSARRVWRVMDMVASRLGLSPFVETMDQGYPFSVRPDMPVTIQQVMTIMRDHYEDTAFDLTLGIAAGPYGDADRYDISASLDGSTSLEESALGSFERSISIFRTSYTVITQSRSYLPDEVGALVWLSQYKPSMSTFIPLYVYIDEVPYPYTVGSLLRFNNDSSYWVFNAVGNWASRYRRFAHEDVVAQQSVLEGLLFESQAQLEFDAVDLVSRGVYDEAKLKLTNHSHESADAAVSSFRTLFDTLLAKYHDGYQMKGLSYDSIRMENQMPLLPSKDIEMHGGFFFHHSITDDCRCLPWSVQDPTAETIKMDKMFYPKSWLEVVGFFDTLQADSHNAMNYENGEQQQLLPASDAVPSSTSDSDGIVVNALLRGTLVGLAVGALTLTLVGVLIGRWSVT